MFASKSAAKTPSSSTGKFSKPSTSSGPTRRSSITEGKAGDGGHRESVERGPRKSTGGAAAGSAPAANVHASSGYYSDDSEKETSAGGGFSSGSGRQVRRQPSVMGFGRQKHQVRGRVCSRPPLLVTCAAVAWAPPRSQACALSWTVRRADSYSCGAASCAAPMVAVHKGCSEMCAGSVWLLMAAGVWCRGLRR